MNLDNPRLLARLTGAFYLVITACALYAYMHIRGQLIVSGDIAQTATNILAQEQLFRISIAASVIVVLCNLPMGFLLFELLKVVNRRVAMLALMFIAAAAILEAGNPLNSFQTLRILNTPEMLSAFDENQRLGLARLSIRLFNANFSVSLSFFGVFCVLTGYLIIRSTFLPRILGVFMVLSGLAWLINCFSVFLALPEIPHLLKIPLIGENALMVWLLIFGVNEARWREQLAGEKA